MKIKMGKKYKTRDGRDVRILAVNFPGEQPVIGVVQGYDYACTWNADGCYFRTGKFGAPRDLVEVPEVPESTTIYAAASAKSPHGMAPYVTSRVRADVDNHARREGPVVEVTLPRDPPMAPKPAVKLKRALTTLGAVSDDVYLVAEFTDGTCVKYRLGEKTAQFEHVALVADQPKGLEWHATGFPEPNRRVLVDGAVVGRRRHPGRDARRWTGLFVRRLSNTGEWLDQDGDPIDHRVLQQVNRWAYVDGLES